MKTVAVMLALVGFACCTSAQQTKAKAALDKACAARAVERALENDAGK